MKTEYEGGNKILKSMKDSELSESCENENFDSEQKSMSYNSQIKDVNDCFACISTEGDNSKPFRSADHSSKGFSVGDDIIVQESEIDEMNEEDGEYQRNLRYDLKHIFDLNVSHLELKIVDDDDDKPYFKIKDSLKFLTNSLENQENISLSSWDNYIKLRLKKILNKKKGSVCLQQLLPLCENIGLIDSIYDEVSL